jgi:hypothetical protein
LTSIGPPGEVLPRGRLSRSGTTRRPALALVVPAGRETKQRQEAGHPSGRPSVGAPQSGHMISVYFSKSEILV